MVTLTVNDVIERARARHWTFNDVQMPAGAILQFIDDRQRSIILQIAEQIEGLIGESREIEVGVSGDAVVAFDALGAPYFSTGSTPGYVLKIASGIPYIDLSDLYVVDPFGEDGGQPGFPLPENILWLGAIVANLEDGRTMPVLVLDNAQAAAVGGTTGLRSFLSGNRLVPIRASTIGGTGVQDWWNKVTSIRLSMIVCPQLVALADSINLPAPLVEYLIAAVCDFLAKASPKTQPIDKRTFADGLREAKIDVLNAAESIVGGVQQNSVIARR